MSELSELINRWQNSSLSLKESETLINLLIAENHRVEAMLGATLNEIKAQSIEEALGSCQSERYLRSQLEQYAQQMRGEK